MAQERLYVQFQSTKMCKDVYDEIHLHPDFGPDQRLARLAVAENAYLVDAHQVKEFPFMLEICAELGNLKPEQFVQKLLEMIGKENATVEIISREFPSSP